MCFLIPIYNHHAVLGLILEQLVGYQLPCIMVDDGSSQECEQEIRRVAALYDFAQVVRLPVNGGKGHAVLRGLETARQQGYSHALQLDADGQHDLRDIPQFLRLAQQMPAALILGQARYDDSVPASRHYGRYLTHVWVWIETLSFKVKDSMCGFRVYPVRTALAVCEGKSVGLRMDFDIEIVVRLSWWALPIISIPTLVRYPLDGISHFDVLKDNIRISRTHAKLFFGMLMRLPLLIARKFGFLRPALAEGDRL